MSIYHSTKNFENFFEESSRKNYSKLREDPNSKLVFEFLQQRIDWLIASITNHRKPALQGVVVDLEQLLLGNELFQEKIKNNKDSFFITMIGAMVCYLVEEFGFYPERSGVALRNNSIISTASTYGKKS